MRVLEYSLKEALHSPMRCRTSRHKGSGSARHCLRETTRLALAPYQTPLVSSTCSWPGCHTMSPEKKRTEVPPSAPLSTWTHQWWLLRNLVEASQHTNLYPIQVARKPADTLGTTPTGTKYVHDTRIATRERTCTLDNTKVPTATN